MTLHKAPSLNRVSHNAIKALDEDHIQVLFDICSSYLKISLKGVLTNVNNWRGINLLNVASIVMSIVITSRLQVVFSGIRNTNTIWIFTENRTPRWILLFKISSSYEKRTWFKFMSNVRWSDKIIFFNSSCFIVYTSEKNRDWRKSY